MVTSSRSRATSLLAALSVVFLLDASASTLSNASNGGSLAVTAPIPNWPPHHGQRTAASSSATTTNPISAPTPAPSKPYDPKNVEGRWYEVWEKAGYFQPATEGKPYVIVIETTPYPPREVGGFWWDVAVPEVSDRAEVIEARAAYEAHLQNVGKRIT